MPSKLTHGHDSSESAILHARRREVVRSAIGMVYVRQKGQDRNWKVKLVVENPESDEQRIQANPMDGLGGAS